MSAIMAPARSRTLVTAGLAILGLAVCRGLLSETESALSLAELRHAGAARGTGEAGPELTGVGPGDAALPSFVGVASCASENCHGKPGPRGAKSSEYNTWIRFDLHSQAYSRLFDKRS